MQPARTRAPPPYPCTRPGVLQSLSFVFKLGQRSRLLPVAPRVWALALAALDSPHAAGSVTARKLAVKLLQVRAAETLNPETL